MRAQYPYVLMVDSVARMLTIKQYDDSLLDYAKRFKQARDVMKTYIGSGLLDAFVERSEEYIAENDVDKKKELKKDAWNRLMAYLFLKGADSSKYGSLTKKFTTDFSGGVDTYPKTLQKVLDILTNHQFDDTYSEKKKVAAAREKEKQRTDSEQATSFAQKEREKKQRDYICHCCGKKGHKSTECRHQNNIPKSEWWFHKALQNYEEQQPDAGTNNQTTQNNESDQQHRSVQRTNSARTEQAIAENQNSSQVTAWNGYQERRQGFQGFQRHYQVRNRNDLTPKSTFLQKNQDQLKSNQISNQIKSNQI